MSIIPDNYLAVEPLIIARLQSELAGMVEAVGGIVEYEQALADPESPRPAAYVLYAGDAAVENVAGQGRASRPVQHWQVGLLLRPAIDDQSGRASMAGAGRLITRVLKALAGWRAAEGFQPLRRVQERGQAVYYADGQALIVLDFEVGVPITIG